MQATLAYLHFKTLDSTHLWCKRELASVREFLQKSQMLVVTCDHQTAGIGRSGSSWKAGKRHLAIELCFKAFKLDPVTLSLTLSNALSLWLQRQGVPAKLKWPNDIWTARGKIAGVIAEISYFEEEAICLAGIGLNISNPDPSLEEIENDLNESLIGSIDQPIDYAERYLVESFNLSSLAIDISSYIREELEDQQIAPDDINLFMKDSWTCPGSFIEAVVEEGRIEGTILKFTQQGDLILRTLQGEEISLRSGLCKKVRLLEMPQYKPELAIHSSPIAHIGIQTITPNPSTPLRMK